MEWFVLLSQQSRSAFSSSETPLQPHLRADSSGVISVFFHFFDFVFFLSFTCGNSFLVFFSHLCRSELPRSLLQVTNLISCDFSDLWQECLDWNDFLSPWLSTPCGAVRGGPVPLAAVLLSVPAAQMKCEVNCKEILTRTH